MNNNIIKKIYKQSTIKNINSKLKLLGNDSKFKNAIVFLNYRIITTILFVIICLLCKANYLFIPFFTIIYYYLFYYLFITIETNKRIVKLDKQALMFFEILSLTLESGKNLENALIVTCDNIDSELSMEFKKCLIEVKLGRTLMESLDKLRERIPSETINNIILNITQTSIFGNSIIATLSNQVEYLREKQIMQIKEQINKIPNKVSIVSVIFIIPLILLMILGPVILDLL